MRWLWGAHTASAIALSGCGGSGGNGNTFPGGEDSGGGGGGGIVDATTQPVFPQDGTGNDTSTHPTCQKRTCADYGATCGPVADGCGNSIDCGSCTNPGESCV